MRFGVLGPVAVWTDGGKPVSIPGLKVRALLVDLLAHEGRPVPVDRLIEDLWGQAWPANPAAALQVRVSQLRRALEDAEPGARDLVVSRAPGYLLEAEPDTVDARRFDALVERARATDDPRLQASLLGDALGLWRGPAFADFGDEEFTRAASARWEERRLAALEHQADVRLELGEHSQLAGELGDLVAGYPYREHLRATYMRALYRAGRQRDALDAYDDLRRTLVDELGLDPSPEVRALHQAILEQDPREAAVPILATARRTTNLPASPTELIGRDSAVAEVRARLATGPLVTLTGSGGVGKTRLAEAVARTLLDSYADGVWLVELAALGPPGEQDIAYDLAEAVMAALGVRDLPSSGASVSTADRLLDVLSTRQLLLVLDNCEHVVEQVAALGSRLLREAPGLRILATSREPLGLADEIVWEVPPLEVPDDVGADPAQLADSSAVQLFVARATAATPGFRLDTRTGPLVARLCQGLDGIPLALELAATRVRGLGVSGLVARLDDRFRVLTTGPRDAPARQRTLTAVIDWSWQLLTEPERIVLRRLAVHADGCTLEAAEAVCPADDLPAADVLDLLARLVDRSLVVMDDHVGGEPRYRLLESVSAYCADRLQEAGEDAQVRRRHADYYLELAQRAEPLLYGHGQQQALRRLDTEAANLRTALDTAARQGAADQALLLADTLAWYWFLRGRLTEAHRSLELALAISGDPSPAARARAQAWLAGMAVLQGDTDDGAARGRAALRLFNDADDPNERARAEWFLAFVTIERGDLVATEELVSRALATFRASGDRWGEAAALSTRAMLAHKRSDLTAMGCDAQRSAELFLELGDQWGVLQATDWLIGRADMTGDYEQASRLTRDGLRMAEDLGLWPDMIGRLGWLGWIAVQLADYGYARECCEQALQIAAEQGLPSAETLPTIGLAFAARRDGKLELAEEHLLRLHGSAQAQRRDADRAYPLYLPMVLVELGLLAEQRDDAASALARHLEAFDIAVEQNAPRDIVWALEGLAAAVSLDGHPALAAELLGVAASARDAAGLPLAPTERDEVGRVIATARAALDDERFDAAFRRGARITPEDARSLVEEAYTAADDGPARSDAT